MIRIKTVVIAAAAIAAAVLAAPSANADPSAFLTTMDSLGLVNADGPDAALSDGYQICGLLRDGHSPQHITDWLYDSNIDKSFTRDDAYDVVRAAAFTLC